MKNAFLFRGLTIDQETQEKLDERISKRIDSAIESTFNPFDYATSYDSWHPTTSMLLSYPDFPNGGYDTESQALIALALWRSSPKKLDYQKLYSLSKFILQGLQ
jgi:hypothetical protein